MLLVVGGIKGGSGKTTLVTNLAILRAAAGKKVLLVDADEQRSASDWSDQRTELTSSPIQFVTISLIGKSIHSQLLKLKNDFDDIIVDVGGRDTTSQRSALTVADIFLVPFKPRSFDVWTIGSLKTMLGEVNAINHNLKAYAIINQADSKGNDNIEALEILNSCHGLECIPFTIGQRKAFANAATDGLGVVEMKISDKKANSEIESLYKYIYKSDSRKISEM